ncbi:MAG: DUF11 domain-containing protein [Burkholderiaceae bacterium]|jgi:uncharacterized repeat protein (TIGR01451 family)|nr:DUF11 domain-containing protein [Burkholderiaceae bacterium]
MAFILMRGPACARPKPDTPASRPLRWLVAGGLLAAGTAFAAPADTDILVNHDGLYAGVDASAGPAGGNFTYVAKVRHNNIGPDAQGVTLTELLPAGAIFQSYDGSPSAIVCNAPPAGTVLTAANQTLSCQIGSLAPADGFKSVAFHVILPTVGTNWRAVASATMAAPDYDQDQNNSLLERNFTTTEAADLAIALSAPASVANGGAFQYTIDVANQGPSGIPAGGRAQVRFPVPNGAVVMARPSGSGWTCTPASGYPLMGAELACSYPGPVAPGAVLPTISVPAIANMSGTISGAASVKGYKDATTDMPDGQTGNNTDSAAVVSSGSDFVDVSLRKQVSPTLIDALEPTQVTYTLQPRREGGAIVPRDLVITDQLPAGLQFDGFDGSVAPWNCGVAAGTITCTHAGEYPVASYAAMQPIRFKATVPAGGTPGSPLVNQGVIALPPELNEPNQGNNTDSVAVDFSNESRLSLSKSGPSRPVLAGQEFEYTITVRNNGPMPVLPGQRITVSDNPADPRMTLVGMSGTGMGAGEWSCAASACESVAGLAVGDSRQVRVRAKVALASGHLVFVNQASAGVDGRDNASVTGSANVTVSADAVDVGIVKSVVDPVPPAAIKSGEEVTYLLRVTNHSASVAVSNVNVTDELTSLVKQTDGVRMLGGNPVDEAGNPVPYRYPGGGFVSSRIVSGDNASCGTPSGGVNSSSRTLSCSISSMAAGAEVVIEVKIRPVHATGGAYANTARAQSSDIHDADPGNDSSRADINVQAIVDIAAQKQVSPKVAAAGEPLTYTVTVPNYGPSSAAQVTLRDLLPAQAVFIGTPTVSGGGSCTPAATDGLRGGTLECAWANPLTAGAQYTVSYKMRSLGDLPADTEITNTVAVDTTTEELTKANNQAEAQARLKRAELDVNISMRHTADGLVLGEDTEYTITVTNSGPSYATQVVVTDEFPAAGSSATFSYQDGLALAGVAGASTAWCGTQPALNATSGPLACTIPVLAPGESLTIRFKMRAQSLPDKSSGGTIYHRATVKPLETEWLSSGADVIVNNSTSDRTSTSRQGNAVDLGLVKQGPAGPLEAGDDVAYTLTVTNYGRDARSPAGATVTDVLPAGLEFVSASAGCSHDSASRTVTCSVAPLDKGASAVFTLQTRLAKPYKGARPLVNQATVSVPGDGNPDNDKGTSTTPVKPGPDDIASVPTLSQAALLLLAALMGLTALLLGDRAGRRR